MPTYNLGTATVSTRVAQLLSSSFRRNHGSTLTAAEILDLIREEIRARLVQRVLREKELQRRDTGEDETLDGEVTI